MIGSNKHSEIFLKARKNELEYHDHLYKNLASHSPSTRLQKPVKLIMDTASALLRNTQKPISILDLGCGMGRNSIPLAQMLSTGDTITCVDILNSALQQLHAYAQDEQVHECIIPIQADVEKFEITEEKYTFIFSVSCIEHVSSTESFKQVIKRIQNGTAAHGINCLMLYSNVRWIDMKNNKDIEPLVELNLNTQETLSLLKKRYNTWGIQKLYVKPWKADMIQEGKHISFEASCICLVAKRK
jgi:cyclopropane fatty-acyl-phospholipid synthase-like methyltransferase